MGRRWHYESPAEKQAELLALSERASRIAAARGVDWNDVIRLLLVAKVKREHPTYPAEVLAGSVKCKIRMLEHAELCSTVEAIMKILEEDTSASEWTSKVQSPDDPKAD